MWVQGLLLLCGADPHGRIDGMCAGLGSRGRQESCDTTARGACREERLYFFFGAAGLKCQPCSHKCLFRDCLFPRQPLD